MNRLAILMTAALLTFSIAASASEVADAAKKERARREALRKEGKPAKTFTNQDVADLKSPLAFEVTTPAEPEETTEPSEVTTLPAAPAAEPAPEQTTAQEQQADEEAEKLKQEREQLEQQAKDAQQTINQGGGYHTRNIGSQYKAKREAEARIRQIDEELEKKEDKEGNEANEE